MADFPSEAKKSSSPSPNYHKTLLPEMVLFYVYIEECTRNARQLRFSEGRSGGSIQMTTALFEEVVQIDSTTSTTPQSSRMLRLKNRELSDTSSHEQFNTQRTTKAKIDRISTRADVIRTERKTHSSHSFHAGCLRRQGGAGT